MKKIVFPHFYFLFEFAQSCTTLVYIIGLASLNKLALNYGKVKIKIRGGKQHMRLINLLIFGDSSSKSVDTGAVN